MASSSNAHQAVQVIRISRQFLLCETCKELKLGAPEFGIEPSIGTYVVGWVCVEFRRSVEETTLWHCRLVGSAEADASAATENVAQKAIDFLRSIMRVEVDDFNYSEVQSASFTELCLQRDIEFMNQTICTLKEDVKKQQRGWIGALNSVHVLQQACATGLIIRDENGNLIPELVSAGVTAEQAQPVLARITGEVFRVYVNSASKRRSFGVLEA